MTAQYPAHDEAASLFPEEWFEPLGSLFRERETILEMPTRTPEILIGLPLQQPLGVLASLIEFLVYYLLYITAKTHFSDSFLEHDSLVTEVLALFLVPSALFILRGYLSAHLWYRPRRAKQIIRWQKKALEQLMAHRTPNTIHPEFLSKHWHLIEQLMQPRGGDIEAHYLSLRHEKETYEAYLEVNRAEATIVTSLEQIYDLMFLHSATIQRTGGDDGRSKPLNDFSAEYEEVIKRMLRQARKIFPEDSL